MYFQKLFIIVSFIVRNFSSLLWLCHSPSTIHRAVSPSHKFYFSRNCPPLCHCIRTIFCCCFGAACVSSALTFIAHKRFLLWCFSLSDGSWSSTYILSCAYRIFSTQPKRIFLFLDLRTMNMILGIWYVCEFKWDFRTKKDMNAHQSRLHKGCDLCNGCQSKHHLESRDAYIHSTHTPFQLCPQIQRKHQTMIKIKSIRRNSMWRCSRFLSHRIIRP